MSKYAILRLILHHLEIFIRFVINKEKEEKNEKQQVKK